MNKGSSLPLICTLLFGAFAVAGYMSEYKILYLVSGASIGFIFGVSLAIGRLFKEVKGQEITDVEEETALRKLFKI